MKRNTLFALIALGLGGVSVANAQDFSNWYLAPRLGADFADSKRTTDTSLFAGIGIGTWVNPNLALDLEYGINNADFKDSSPRNSLDGRSHQWESVQLDIAGRWFWGEFGGGWRPYIMGGVGALRHKAYSGVLLHDGLSGAAVPPKGVAGGFSSGGGWDPMATLGVGVQYNLSERLAFRGEVAARYDHDNSSLNSACQGGNGIAVNCSSTGALPANLPAAYGFKRVSHFVDGLATVALVWSFGGGHAAPPPSHPATPPPPPAQPEREPVKQHDVTIDLRGVEFKFDHPKVGEKLEPSLKAPTADSVAILDQAVDTLKRYPNVRVEVDGHTDSKGSDAYNQKLSERRAHGVYEYLTSHGVSSSQIAGERGFGESQPIDTNDTAAGRQRNRRVELKVQN